ncbi:MAG: YtxH domain-containing protein [Actinobacteria bacterium]|nr:YtxH domain-containing protein [Actinomycetota bacterium]MBL7060661.1 YtxH domain-containing protein [Actinomycetota bacterium]
MNDSNNNFGVIKGGAIGFAIGFVVGAVAALFLTTKTGEELREELKKVALDLKKKVEERAGTIKNLTKERYTEIINNVIANYKKVKELTEKEIDLIKDIIMKQEKS